MALVGVRVLAGGRTTAHGLQTSLGTGLGHPPLLKPGTVPHRDLVVLVAPGRVQEDLALAGGPRGRPRGGPGRAHQTAGVGEGHCDDRWESHCNEISVKDHLQCGHRRR